MKKMGKLLLCAGILFTTAACGSKEDPIDTKALDKLEEVIKQTESFKSGSYSLDITSSGEGETVKGKLHGEFIASENAQISMNLDLESKDQPEPVSMTLYLLDNSLYADLMGSKMKLSLDSASALSGVELPEKDSEKDDKKTYDVKTLKKVLKSATLSDNKIAMEFDSKKFKDYMNDGESLPDSLTSEMKGATINKLTFDVKYDKQNYLTGMKFYLNLTKKVDDEKVTGKITFNFTMKDRNKIEKIEFPTDLDTYIDLASAMSGLGDPTLPDNTDDLLTDESLDDGL